MFILHEIHNSKQKSWNEMSSNTWSNKSAFASGTRCNTCYRLEPQIHHAPTEYDQIYRLLTGYNGGCQGVLPYISNNSTKISNKGAKTSNPQQWEITMNYGTPWGYSLYEPLYTPFSDCIHNLQVSQKNIQGTSALPSPQPMPLRRHVHDNCSP